MVHNKYFLFLKSRRKLKDTEWQRSLISTQTSELIKKKIRKLATNNREQALNIYTQTVITILRENLH